MDAPPFWALGEMGIMPFVPVFREDWVGGRGRSEVLSASRGIDGRGGT